MAPEFHGGMWAQANPSEGDFSPGRLQFTNRAVKLFKLPALLTTAVNQLKCAAGAMHELSSKSSLLGKAVSDDDISEDDINEAVTLLRRYGQMVQQTVQLVQMQLAFHD